ncbi:hypothetical protein Tco_0382731 [Tanacetum coccineum]
MKVLAHHSFYLRGPSLIPKTQREIYNSLIGNYLPQLLLINQGTTLSTMWIKPSPLDLRCRNINHNKGKTSSEVEPNIIAPIQSLKDYELLMEDFKELSDEEIYEVEDEMEDAFPLNNEVAENNWEKHEEAPTSYDNLKWEVKDFHETTFRATSKTDAHMRNFEKILTQDKAQHLKKKVLAAAEAYTKHSLNLTKLLTLVKDLDLPCIKSTIESLHAPITTQNNLLAEWVESSASMAWSVGPRLTKIQNTQAIIQIDMATLKTDTADIKAMVTEIFCAFKGQAFSASSEKGGSSQITPRVDKGNAIATKDDPLPPKLVKASREVIMDPDVPMLIE